MKDPRPGEPSRTGEQPSFTRPSSEEENDPETIADRVVDVFWKTLHASQDDES